MTTLDYKSIGHLNPLLLDGSTQSLDGASLAGRWINTNDKTRGITECLIEVNGAQFTIKLRAAGSGRSISWPTVTARTLANLEEEANQRAHALAASFVHGFMTTDIYIRVNKGVLVIVLFNCFRDNSGRSDYVTREFFYRAG